MYVMTHAGVMPEKTLGKFSFLFISYSLVSSDGLRLGSKETDVALSALKNVELLEKARPSGSLQSMKSQAPN